MGPAEVPGVQMKKDKKNLQLTIKQIKAPECPVQSGQAPQIIMF